MKTAARPHRVFHWIGLMLTLPILGAAVFGLYLWLAGALPSTVTTDVVLGVMVIAMVTAGGVYLLCRGIGWTIAKVMEV